MKIKKNNLTITHPNLMKEWHPAKNGDLKPTEVTAGSGKKCGGSVSMGMSEKRQ